MGALLYAPCYDFFHLAVFEERNSISSHRADTTKFTKKVLLNLIDIPVPVIAALNEATTVHSEYALLENIVIATPETVFQDKPHFAFGIVPGDGVHLLRPDGRGRTFRAEEAIVDESVAFGPLPGGLPREIAL